MKFYARLMLASAALSVALTFAWVMAFLSLAHRHHDASPRLRPPSREAPGPSRELPAASLDSPYVATEIGKTYHRPECFYIVKQSRHTLLPFKTREEAEATGRHACTNCLSTSQIARSTRKPLDPE